MNIICTVCKKEKDEALFYPNKAKRNGRTSECKECHKASTRQWAKKNLAACVKANNKWRKSNPEKVKEIRAAFYRKDLEKSRAYNKKKYNENHDGALATAKKYRQANPDKINEASMRYYAKKSGSTPLWGNKFFLQEAYALARLRGKFTGLKWHVDHIVPIRSKIVCGLHAHTNVQVIPATINQRKQNKFWPDMSRSVL